MDVMKNKSYQVYILSCKILVRMNFRIQNRGKNWNFRLLSDKGFTSGPL